MLKCQIIGNIGGDPDLRYTANGQARLSFTVASNGRTRNAAGEWVESTEWVRCTVFGQRAEALGQRLTRGTRVYCRRGPDVDISDLDDGPIRVSSADERRQPVAAGSRYATGADDVDLDGLPF